MSSPRLQNASMEQREQQTRTKTGTKPKTETQQREPSHERERQRRGDSHKEGEQERDALFRCSEQRTLSLPGDDDADTAASKPASHSRTSTWSPRVSTHGVLLSLLPMPASSPAPADVTAAALDAILSGDAAWCPCGCGCRPRSTATRDLPRCTAMPTRGLSSSSSVDTSPAADDTDADDDAAVRASPPGRACLRYTPSHTTHINQRETGRCRGRQAATVLGIMHARRAAQRRPEHRDGRHLRGRAPAIGR
jgi:hypothetical protein